MGDPNTYPKWAMSPGELDLHLLLALDAANAPAFVGSSAWAAQFVSIVRNSAGNYTIALREKFLSMKGFGLALQAHTAVDLVPQLGDVDVSSGKTAVVRLLTGAVETDPPAKGANACVLSVRLTLQNSSAKGG